MVVGTLIVSDPGWLWPAAALFIVGLGLLWWGYRPAPNPRVRWACAALKTAGIVLLAFCLLEPRWLGQRAKPGANLFAIVADNSLGLQIKDAGESSSRGEAMSRLLSSDDGGWQAAMEEVFELRRFQFDTRLTGVRDWSGLDFEGRASMIGGALHGLRERFENRPLAGMLLFTDGNATDLRRLGETDGLPPVYPVVVGHSEAVRDVALVNTRVTQTAFEDAPVTLQAEVTASGLRGETVRARLMDAAGNTVRELRQRVRQPDETLTFRFQFRPESAGLSFHQVTVSVDDDAGAVTDASREATLLNNRRVVAVDRGGGPYRVLYVAGRPNWEYKFLNRALAADDQLQLVALIRVAHREPKFEFRGRAGETGNPLFRGFGDQSREEVERYDRPVLTRLNTRDELELAGGFPSTAEDLYGYHAVILDDVEAGFFTADQAMLLQKFVSERGGGLLMLGGMESFREGGYHRTPVGEMLPVYLDRADEAGAAGPARFDLAREGWLQPWARLRDNEQDEAARLDAMPDFRVVNPVSEIKPGASVLATVEGADGAPRPALASQRFGRGRTAVLTVGDFWRWGMQDEAARQDMEKAWRQLARWLVADVPQRVELTVEDSPETAPGAVKLQVRVRDAAFEPMDEATVMLEVAPALLTDTNASAAPIRLRPDAAGEEPGLFQSIFVPGATGGYRVTAGVTNALGVSVGQVEAGWSSDLLADEFRQLQPNVALLEDIARRTGGEIVDATSLKSFAKRVPQEAAPVMESWTSPAWHTPWLFGVALGCFVAEWGVRRWKGLP